MLLMVAYRSIITISREREVQNFDFGEGMDAS